VKLARASGRCWCPGKRAMASQAFIQTRLFLPVRSRSKLCRCSLHAAVPEISSASGSASAFTTTSAFTSTFACGQRSVSGKIRLEISSASACVSVRQRSRPRLRLRPRYVCQAVAFGNPIRDFTGGGRGGSGDMRDRIESCSCSPSSAVRRFRQRQRSRPRLRLRWAGAARVPP
jgi:hypothetical protein